MPSVVIPAHNEQMVIERCLRSFLAGPLPDELEVIVVCNGCTDETARVAREVDPLIQVIETDVPSKSNALNLGDATATTFPRMYLDADIELGPGALQACFDVIQGGVHASAPRAVFEYGEASLPVRMFHTAWLRVPYFNGSMIGTGVYTMSEEGRNRFDHFPSIIADDGFARLQFDASERVAVPDVTFTIRIPQTLESLISIKSRVLAGSDELFDLYPELLQQEETNKPAAVAAVLKRPHLWPSFVVYVAIKRAIRKRVEKKKRTGELGKWDRDDSSRTGD